MKTAFFVCLLFILSGCKQKETISTPKDQIDIEAELKKIEATRTKFMNAVKNKDGEAMRTAATSDVITIGPGSADWGEMYSNSNVEGPFPYDSIIMFPKETIIVSDSIAYDFGVSKVYFTSSNGEVKELQDTFLAIIKKGKDGTWRLHREVASSNVSN